MSKVLVTGDCGFLGSAVAARLVAAGRALAPVVYSDGSPQTAEVYRRYETWLGGN